MTDEQLISIDPEKLAEIVARVLDEPGAYLGEWQIKPLTGGMEAFNRVYLLSGQAQTSSGERPWSVVLKTMQRDPSTDETPQGIRYWKREASLYQSGLLADLSDSLSAPRCYGVHQRGEMMWIWMEPLQDVYPRPWSPDLHAAAARCLGCFNGAYLAGRPLPQVPWLASHWLRGYTELTAANIRDLPQLRKLPFFQSTYADLSDAFILQAWERRGEFLAALERLPQTFCHQDAFTGNLFWHHDPAGRDHLVGLDWAFAGNAALGEELAPLMSMTLGLIPGLEGKLGFYELCLQGYLAGLADAGYAANEQQVRFASLATIFYRYFFGGTLGELWNAARDEANHPFLASLFGVPSIDVLFNILRDSSSFYQAIYQQASELLPHMQ